MLANYQDASQDFVYETLKIHIHIREMRSEEDPSVKIPEFTEWLKQELSEWMVLFDTYTKKLHQSYARWSDRRYKFLQFIRSEKLIPTDRTEITVKYDVVSIIHDLKHVMTKFPIQLHGSDVNQLFCEITTIIKNLSTYTEEAPCTVTKSQCCEFFRETMRCLYQLSDILTALSAELLTLQSDIKQITNTHDLLIVLNKMCSKTSPFITIDTTYMNSIREISSMEQLQKIGLSVICTNTITAYTLVCFVDSLTSVLREVYNQYTGKHLPLKYIVWWKPACICYIKDREHNQ